MNALPREICIARPFGETYFSPISSDCSENFKFRFAFISLFKGIVEISQPWNILKFFASKISKSRNDEAKLHRLTRLRRNCCSEKQKHLANDIEKMDGIGWNAGKGRRKPVKS